MLVVVWNERVWRCEKWEFVVDYFGRRERTVRLRRAAYGV